MRLYLNKKEVPVVERALRIFKYVDAPVTQEELNIAHDVLDRIESLKYIEHDIQITITVSGGGNNDTI